MICDEVGFGGRASGIERGPVRRCFCAPLKTKQRLDILPFYGGHAIAFVLIVRVFGPCLLRPGAGLAVIAAIGNAQIDPAGDLLEFLSR